tara:strand:- start:233 stop:655 length:423 start_codon:yes stop_codon:yes gene_type:complete
MMNVELIFVPVLAHIMLIFMVYIYLGVVKSRAVKEGSVDRKLAALNTKAWPEDVVKVSNNLANQFESPIIFYVLSIIYFITDNVSGVIIVLMSLYVLSRYIHAYIHVTTNYVPNRYKFFLIGVLTLLGLSIWLILRIVGI